MARRLLLGLALVLAWPPAFAAPSSSAAPSGAGVEWIVEDGATLTLRLVREEGTRICGGELIIDSRARTVSFTGAPGAIGCRMTLQGSFDDVKAVRTQRRSAGFMLEMAAKNQKLVLLPLPHFQWFQEQGRVSSPGAVERQLLDAGVSMGPDDDPVRRLTSTAPTLKNPEPPREVVADTQKAVDLVREALGRTPAPEELLREILQGRPLDASLSEVLEEPGTFAASPVRMRGRLVQGPTETEWRIDEQGRSIAVEPAPGTEGRFGLVSAWKDREVELVGRLKRRPPPPAGGLPADEHYFETWECIGPDAMATAEGIPLTLSQLLAGMQQHEGELVRVVGRFRGRNLHGDLPATSQKSLQDWVIKSERAAIWVTGRKPGGQGWSLNLEAPGSSEWLEVVGRPRVRGAVAYLRATKVALVSAPPGARVVPARRLRGRPDQPPSVVFSLPLEGEAVGLGSRIVVQFDRDMDEESFRNRVRLREEAGNEVAVRLLYDESRRSLVINPLRPLRSGHPVRVELLPGIVDLDGMPLAPRPGHAVAGDAIDVLRYASEGD